MTMEVGGRKRERPRRPEAPACTTMVENTSLSCKWRGRVLFVMVAGKPTGGCFYLSFPIPKTAAEQGGVRVEDLCCIFSLCDLTS